MVAVKIVQLAVMAAAIVSAAPTAPQSTPDAFKRALAADVTCGQTSANQQKWLAADIQNAYNSLVAFGNGPGGNKPKAGTRAYPMQYGTKNKNTPSDQSVVNALNAIPGCQTGQQGYKYFEFPITSPDFTGGPQGSQGPDRVIAISPSPGQGGTRSYAYCLAITHRDEKNPGEFDPCT